MRQVLTDSTPTFFFKHTFLVTQQKNKQKNNSKTTMYSSKIHVPKQTKKGETYTRSNAFIRVKLRSRGRKLSCGSDEVRQRPTCVHWPFLCLLSLLAARPLHFLILRTCRLSLAVALSTSSSCAPATPCGLRQSSGTGAESPSGSATHPDSRGGRVVASQTPKTV